MASLAVITAVEAQISANWTNTPVILPSTTGEVPANGSATLVIEFPIANEEQITLGAPGTRVFRETGVFLITLLIPVGVGLNPIATPYSAWVDALRAVFRGTSFSGVNTWAPPPPHFNDESDKGAYSEISFAVPYYFDLAG